MRTIAQICPQTFYKYKMIFNNIKKEWEVKDKNNFTWGAGKTTKGAIISTCNQGIKLRNIDITAGYVPIQEVIQAIKD